MNTSYYGERQRPFSTVAGREEFYLCGYLYVHWLYRGSAEAANPMARALRDLRRVRAARSLDREFRVLWRVQRPRLDVLNDRRLPAWTITSWPPICARSSPSATPSGRSAGARQQL
jgi:hypothetical protein